MELTPGHTLTQQKPAAPPATRGGLAITLSILGQHALMAGHHAAAETMHREALAAAETVDNDYLRAEVLDMLGLDAATAGARARYAAAAALHARLLNYEGSAYCLSGLAGLALTALSPGPFTAATAEDTRLRIPDALAYGLAATTAQQVPDPFPAWTARLRPVT